MSVLRKQRGATYKLLEAIKIYQFTARANVTLSEQTQSQRQELQEQN